MSFNPENPSVPELLTIASEHLGLAEERLEAMRNEPGIFNDDEVGSLHALISIAYIQTAQIVYNEELLT